MRQPLLRCYYPPWALNRLHTKINHKVSTNQAHILDNKKEMNKSNSNNNNKIENHNIFLVVPYTKGASESFKKVCRKLEIQVHFKGNSTICTPLVASKDKETTAQKSGVIYQLRCTQAGCKEEYIRELGRTFWNRLREYSRAPTPFPASLQDIPSLWTAFPLWARKYTVLLWPSSRPCLFESMIHPSTGIWVSISCPTSGMRSYRTPKPSTLGNHLPPTYNGPTSPMAHMGAHIYSSYW